MNNFTNKQAQTMYLDWFNNYLSTEKFAEHYNLSMVEVENILDRGRKLNYLNALSNEVDYLNKQN
tara:strand:+ start:1151 stop:1345 length:195 start_codon:yes stop_codon:yes gene_type:complete